MSFALSSIVRTRQKKSFFSLFILTLLLFHPSGVQASEAYYIDSMDIHPKNRWSESEAGFSGEVSNGILNMTDVPFLESKYVCF